MIFQRGFQGSLEALPNLEQDFQPMVVFKNTYIILVSSFGTKYSRMNQVKFVEKNL